MKAVNSIRRKVFVKEQNVPPDLEFDDHDTEAVHLLLLEKGIPCACARIRYPDNKVKLERLAVLKEHRGKGMGSALMEYMIMVALRSEPEEIMIHSQVSVEEFYRQFGFRSRGGVFMDAGIPHVEMFMGRLKNTHI